MLNVTIFETFGASEFEYLPTNDTCAKDTPNDPDLLFQGEEIEIVIS